MRLPTHRTPKNAAGDDARSPPRFGWRIGSTFHCSSSWPAAACRFSPRIRRSVRAARNISWYPFQNDAPPSWLRFGGWLAGARHWHFAIAWFLILNGVIYLIYMIASGEWRRRVFIPTRDTSNALAMFAYYLRVRKTPPPEDFYNGLQRMAYTSAILFGVVVVMSGLAIYKPVQLYWITAAFGGYDVARVVHLSCLVLLAMFTAMHLVLVALHPRTIVTMVTGGQRG